MILLGITGSMGTGKSMVLDLIKQLGFPVLDADCVVRDLLALDQDVVAEFALTFPDAIQHGCVVPARLASIFSHPQILQQAEAILHPRVYQTLAQATARERSAGTRLFAIEVPLLLETPSPWWKPDKILVTHAPALMVKRRVFARPHMTAERYAGILARQMPQHEKLRHAQMVLYTCGTKSTIAKRVALMVNRMLSP